MAYGQNLPFGLQATRTLNSATYNGQTSTYLIKSGYNNNIFRGDPVIIAGASDGGAAAGTLNGYIISIYDAGTVGTSFTSTATVGIFDGCSYIQPTSTNPIDPASPGRPYWPAGQVTVGNIPATAFVVDDPNIIYNVQVTGNPGATQSVMGQCASYAFSATANIVQGNFQTGVSTVAVTNPVAGGTSNSNVIALRLLPSPPNPVSNNPSNPGGNSYNNIEVLIQNHQFAQRPAPRT